MTEPDAALSRRDFLKLSGLGFLGVLLPAAPHTSLLTPPNSSLYQDAFDAQQGRVASRLIWLYDKPSFNGLRTKLYWRDSVLSITDVTVSDDVSDYNRVWYQVGSEGYAYSGTLQPVRTVLNLPSLDIPALGRLGEVSVPYTDAYEKADLNSRAAYRMYYETVHWIMSASTDPADGKIWYQVLDDKFNKRYYAPGEHLRLLSDDELTPLSPDVPLSEKKIRVQLNDQLVFAYESGVPVFATRAATGDMYRYGKYTTPVGQFLTYHKRPTRHMSNGDLTADGYNLPGVPWVMYFSESGLSLHGTFWHNDFGHPKSHGCVNLSPSAAKWLYRWTDPVVKPDQPFAYKTTGTSLEIVN